MRQVLCGLCKRDVPMNDAFTLDGTTVCGPCCEQSGKQSAEHAQPSISRQIDPTVCRRCNKDGGSTSLPTVAGVPVCEACHAHLHDYPFPAWIKGAGVGLALLVVCAAMWNLRFVLAYREMRASMAALGQRDMVRADSMAHSAARRVPESSDLEALASYFDGITTLREGKSAEALASLKKAGARLPPAFGIDDLMLRARMGEAFDKENYDEFLALATQVAAKRPNDATSLATVASAQACKFATTGSESFRDQALAILAQAKALATSDPDFAGYEQRILHRLQSREIIDGKEFQRRFPHGWQERKEAQQ